MTPERWRQLRCVFECAAQCPADERQGYLDQIRAEDADLAAEAADLLAHDARAFAEGFLSATSPVNVKAGLSLSTGADRLIGRRIGPFQIQQHIASGGMGDVYRAVRVEDYRRTVALKVVRNGLAGTELCERFRTERQVLAGLNHPNVVRLLHGGTTEDGLLYFAMEFIDGMSLDRWCAQHQPALRERLLLLLAVARAVHYAHEQGVIHRDLKPSNVLVAADGTPKISDFGLAKYLDSAGPFDGGSQTRTGVILGSPSYLAPEQAGGPSHRMGPATDVYALGAILYELLTGRPPFQGVTLLDTLDQVRSAEPLPPRRLTPKLPRDVETICLKALAKNPSGRYAKAAAFAADLERFLLGLPTMARPVSRAVKSVRWCRRHPAIAGLLAALLLVTTAGFAGVFWQWRQAEAHLAQADRNRDLARENARQAHLAINDLIAVGNDPLLERSDLGVVRRKLWQTALQYYRSFLEQDENDPTSTNPSLRVDTASAQMSLASLLHGLGFATEAESAYAKANSLWQRLLDEEPENATYQLNLTHILFAQSQLWQSRGRSADAYAAYRRVIRDMSDLQSRRPLTDNDAALVLDSYNELAGTQKHQGRLLEIQNYLEQGRTFGEDYLNTNPDSLRARHSLLVIYCEMMRVQQELGHTDLALQIHRRGIEIGQRLMELAPRVASYASQRAQLHFALGSLHGTAGRNEQSLLAYQEADQVLTSALQQDPANFSVRRFQIASRFHSCMCLHGIGRLKEALEVCRQAHQLAEQLDRDHPSHPEIQDLLYRVCFWLGKVSSETGQKPAAIAAFQQGAEVAGQLARQVPDEPKWRFRQGTCLHCVAGMLEDMNRIAEAVDYFRHAAALRESACRDAPDNLTFHADTGGTWHRLGELEERLGYAEEALTAYQHELENLRAATDEKHRIAYQPCLRRFLEDNIRMLRKLGRDKDAAALEVEYKSTGGTNLP